MNMTNESREIENVTVELKDNHASIKMVVIAALFCVAVGVLYLAFRDDVGANA